MNVETLLGDRGTMPEWLNADVTDTLEQLAVAAPSVLMKAQAEGDEAVEALLRETTAARVAEFESILSSLGADDADLNARLAAKEQLNLRDVADFVPERFRTMPARSEKASQ